MEGILFVRAMHYELVHYVIQACPKCMLVHEELIKNALCLFWEGIVANCRQ